MEKYPDIRFFVASINPTIAAKGPYADNKVVKLNQLLRKEFEQEGIWIDTYTYIKKHHIIRPNGLRTCYLMSALQQDSRKGFECFYMNCFEPQIKKKGDRNR